MYIFFMKETHDLDALKKYIRKLQNENARLKAKYTTIKILANQIVKLLDINEFYGDEK